MCLEGLEYSLIGTTMEEEAVVIDGQELPLEDLIDIWTAPLEPVFPNKADEEPEMTPAVPRYVPGSYTHLDVYKRQAFTACRIAAAPPM